MSFKDAIDSNNTPLLLKLIREKNDELNNSIIEKMFSTPLQYAIRRFRINCVNLLLENGASVDFAGEDNAPIIIAVKAMYIDMVDLLLKYNPNLDVSNGEISLLCIGVRCGNTEIMEKLLDAGLDANTQNQLGYTPMCYAVRAGNIPMMNLLLDRGAHLNVVLNKNEDNLLHFAVRFATYRVIKWLCEKNIKCRPNIFNVTPVAEALHNSPVEIIELLLKSYFDLSIESNKQFFQKLGLLNANPGVQSFISKLLGDKSQSDDPQQVNENISPIPINDKKLKKKYNSREYKPTMEEIISFLKSGDTESIQKMNLHSMNREYAGLNMFENAVSMNLIEMVKFICTIPFIKIGNSLKIAIVDGNYNMLRCILDNIPRLRVAHLLRNQLFVAISNYDVTAFNILLEYGASACCEIRRSYSAYYANGNLLFYNLKIITNFGCVDAIPDDRRKKYDSQIEIFNILLSRNKDAKVIIGLDHHKNVFVDLFNTRNFKIIDAFGERDEVDYYSKFELRKSEEKEEEDDIVKSLLSLSKPTHLIKPTKLIKSTATKVKEIIEVESTDDEDTIFLSKMNKRTHPMMESSARDQRISRRRLIST